MGDSRSITDTNGRLLSSLAKISDKVYEGKNVESKIVKAVNDSMIHEATVLKCYPALSKYLVKINDTGEEVLCKTSLLMNGGVIFLFTPRGDRGFCDDLKEPCVFPWSRLDCFVAPVSNSDEWVFLGFFTPTEWVGINPSKQGHFKLIATASLKHYSLSFGLSGLSIVNNGEINKEEIDESGNSVSPKYYSQEEVDALLKEYDDRVKFLEEKLTVDGEIDALLKGYADRINVLEEKLGISDSSTTNGSSGDGNNG